LYAAAAPVDARIADTVTASRVASIRRAAGRPPRVVDSSRDTPMFVAPVEHLWLATLPARPYRSALQGKTWAAANRDVPGCATSRARASTLCPPRAGPPERILERVLMRPPRNHLPRESSATSRLPPTWRSNRCLPSPASPRSSRLSFSAYQAVAVALEHLTQPLIPTRVLWLDTCL